MVSKTTTDWHRCGVAEQGGLQRPGLCGAPGSGKKSKLSGPGACSGIVVTVVALDGNAGTGGVSGISNRLVEPGTAQACTLKNGRCWNPDACGPGTSLSLALPTSPMLTLAPPPNHPRDGAPHRYYPSNSSGLEIQFECPLGPPIARTRTLIARAPRFTSAS